MTLADELALSLSTIQPMLTAVMLLRQPPLAFWMGPFPQLFGDLYMNSHIPSHVSTFLSPSSCSSFVFSEVKDNG